MSPAEKIKVARLALLLNKPFFGEVATRLKLIEMDTKEMPTMATDGRNLYFNPNFVNAITIDQLKFGICHEILHCAFEHFLRENDRDKMVWNMATDYAINWILVRDNIGERIKAIPTLGIEGCLYDEHYAKMPAEQIYDLLMKDSKKQKGKNFDVHIYIKGNDEADGGASGKGDKGDKGDKDMSISPAQAKEIRDEFKDAVMNAAQNHMSENDINAGSVPAEIARIVKTLLEPKLNWRDVLPNTILSHVKSDVSFMRPSRKSISGCAILPGPIPEETIKVACAVDVSGSIGEKQIIDFLSEIKGIMTQYQSFTITLFSFDTECHALAEFNENNIDELEEWTPVGGGGTCIKSAFDFLKKKEIDVDTFVVFSDMEDSSQNSVDPDQIETVWIINNPYNNNVSCPFGVGVNYS